jgi:hypothetical protein
MANEWPFKWPGNRGRDAGRRLARGVAVARRGKSPGKAPAGHFVDGGMLHGHARAMITIMRLD